MVLTKYFQGRAQKGMKRYTGEERRETTHRTTSHRKHVLNFFVVCFRLLSKQSLLVS